MLFIDRSFRVSLIYNSTAAFFQIVVALSLEVAVWRLSFYTARWDGNIVTFELFRCETEEFPLSADYPSMTTAEIHPRFLNFFEVAAYDALGDDTFI